MGRIRPPVERGGSRKWAVSRGFPTSHPNREGTRPARSNLNVTTGIAVTGDGEFVKLWTTKQMGLEVRLMGRQRTVVLDRQHDRARGAVTCNRLRSLGAGTLDHLAQSRLGLLDLPRRHRRSVLSDHEYRYSGLIFKRTYAPGRPRPPHAPPFPRSPSLPPARSPLALPSPSRA